MPINRRLPTKQASLALLYGLCFCSLAGADSTQADTGAKTARSGPPTATHATTTHPQLPGSRLQGEAILRFLGMRIYHARLWVEPDFRPDRPTEHPAVLELEYLRDFKGADIAERSLKEMQRSGLLPDAKAQRWLAQMRRVFPDIRAGDRLTGHFQPGQATRFWHNGRPTGEVADAQFGRSFLGIWLAPTTSEPAMRQALLGGGASNAPGGR